MHAALVVLRKELRELARDWRALAMMIVLPVLLYPALFVVAEQMFLFGQRRVEATPPRVAVVGIPPAGLMDALTARPRIMVFTAAVPARSLLTGERADAVLELQGDATEASPVRATVLFDATNDRSRLARNAVSQALAAWGDSATTARLHAHGLPATLLEPVAVAIRDVAPPQRTGLFILARLLPFVLIMMTILGTFYPAIDLGAGERERGTLEALLTTPVRASRIVAGKFMAVMLVGMIAAALNLASMALTLRSGLFGIASALGLDVALPPGAILLILLALPPLALLFGALFLGISVQARSFREAQSGLTPVFMFGAIPALLPMVPGIALTPATALLPVGGIALLFRDLLAGDASPAPAALALLANLAYAAAALRFAAAAFGSEDIVYASGRKGRGLRGWLRPAAGDPVPTPAAAIVFVAAVAALFFYLGGPIMTAFPGFAGTVVAELAIMAAPAVAFAALRGHDLRRTLSLARPTLRGLVAAVLIGVGAGSVSWLIVSAELRFLHVPPELASLAKEIASRGMRAPALAILALSVVPAFAEELVFRGVLLAGTVRRLSLGAVILLNALVFGAFHLTFQTGVRFLPTAWLGLLLALLVIRTRSIWTSMLAHAINNALFVGLALRPELAERLVRSGVARPELLLATGAFALAVGIALFASEGRERAEAPSPA